MPGFLMETLYEFKNSGDLTEVGYNIATNILDIFNVRRLINNNLRIYLDLNKITIELELPNYTLYTDILINDNIEIYKVTPDFTSCQDFINENNMYQYLISIL